VPFKDETVRRERQREYSRRWYLKNAQHAIKQSSTRRASVKKAWLDYRSKQSCSHCGFSHPAVIDFHHVIRHNKRAVNDLILKQNNLKEAIREAEEKCIPLCANCHRILHFEERRAIKARRKKKA
jgi:hypothetical protein